MRILILNITQIGSVLTLVILSFQALYTFCFVLSAYEIRDLETDGQKFASDSTAWSNSALYTGVTKSYTQCGSSYILGGYQVLGLTGITVSGNHYFQRVFTGLPSHNRIYFTFQLWMLDTWENDDVMEIRLDSITFNGWSLLISSFSSLTNICGGTSKDLAPLKISGSVAHNSSSLTFKIIAKTNETTVYESFGLREVNVLFATNSTLSTNSICANAPLALSFQQCLCPEGQYKDGSNPCRVCHAYCASCFGPLATQCYKCKEGYSFNGTGCFPCYTPCASCNGSGQNQCTSCKSGYVLLQNSTCVAASSCTSPLIKNNYDTSCESPCSPTNFVYWNGACSPTCNSPLKNSTLLNLVKSCQYPCMTSQYLYWNGSCLSTCPSPFKQATSNDRLFCNLPCSNSSDFVYWNGTCSSICEPLLIQAKVDNVVKVCQFPCNNSGEFLYWNGSCKTGCLHPFVSKTEGDKPYCNPPCNSNDYLYLNGTCSSTACGFPYRETVLAGAVNACISVCGGSTTYLYWNDSCLETCPSPLQSSSDYGIQSCNFPCNHGEFLYWNGTCKKTCASPLQQRLEGGVKFCDNPCTSTTDYLFWNGTCGATCPTPLIPRTEASKLYCDLPCGNLADFLYWNGSCLSSCGSPLVRKIQDSVNMCEYPCLPAQYLHWNGACENNCPYPLKPRLESTKNYCDLPCDINDFLYWNGSCLKSCDFPLTNRILNNVKLCEFPCNSASQYLYWNGTCSDTCQSFYTPSVQGGRNFCSPKCPLDQSLLVGNSSCMNTCPGGFFGNDITKLCQECEVSLCNYCPPTASRKCVECKESAILNSDDSCKKCEGLKVEYVKSNSKYHQYRLRLMPSSCDLDLEVVKNNFKISLTTQSLLPGHYFQITKLNKNIYQANLFLTSSLLERKEVQADLLYLKSDMKVPKTLIPQQSLEKIAENGPTAQNTLAGMMGASFGGTLALGAAAALWSILSFQQFVGYFVFINVDLPFQVKLFLSLFQSISWNILPNPLASLTSKWYHDIATMEEELKQYHPPRKFIDYEVTSFFIQNAGSIFATNILLLFILLIVLILKKLPGLRKNRLLKRIKVLLRWNIILRTFLENGIPLSLAVFLQLRIVSFDNVYVTICEVCAIASGIYLILMIGFIVKSLCRRNNSHLDKKIIRKIFGTLYEGMILDKTLGKYYHLLIFLRGILIVFVVTFLEDWPLLQSSLLIYFNIGLIYFLFTKASFINKRLNIINRAKEILILVGEICVMLLQFQLEYKEYYDVIGWIMVGALASALLIELIYTLVIQLLEIKTLYRKLVNFFKAIGRWLSRNTPSNRSKTTIVNNLFKQNQKLSPTTKSCRNRARNLDVIVEVASKQESKLSPKTNCRRNRNGNRQLLEFLKKKENKSCRLTPYRNNQKENLQMIEISNFYP